MAVAPQESESPPAAPPASGPVMLGDRYMIDPGAPLPDFDSPSAKAYAVEDRRESGRAMFALICTPGLPARIQAMKRLRGLEARGLLPLIEWDVIYWPAVDQHCIAVIYEKPKGGRLLPVGASKTNRINEYDLSRKVIEPIMAALQELAAVSVAHRNIRPSNLFFADENKQEVVLGDCVTAPPGFDQPVVAEPIERGMSWPPGRGQGGTTDDLYALGASLVFVLLGYSPVASLSEEELLAQKVEQGSYATICGNARVPLSMLEPIRGMLSDDPVERWGLEELDLWVSGRQMTPIQKKAAQRSDTPYTFAGRGHVTPRTLARAFSRNVRDAAKAVRDEHFDTWMRRGIQMPTGADLIQAFVKDADNQKHTPQGSDDYLIARVCIILDPVGPIRYKGMAFQPDGFGPSMAVELLRQGNNQISAEIISRDLVALWLGHQPQYSPDHVGLERSFSNLKTYLKQNDMGFGIERCLYETNPEMPCQSALLIRYYVSGIEDVLPALDEVANHIDRETRPIDRHIAAFIAARFDENIDPHLKALADPKEETFIIGMLSLLAFLQWRLRTEPLYGLSSWVGGLLQPAINTYHSRTTRRDLEKEIPKLVRQGSLPDLFDLIDNPEKRRQDINAFNVACQQFGEAEAEIQKIESGETANAESMEKVGQQAAAMTSIVITMVVVAILFLVEYW